MAISPLLSGCATDAAIEGEEAPLASTADVYAEGTDSTSVSASDTLTIIAGSAVPTTPGGTTYTFPKLKVESNTTRLIKSITIQFTTAVEPGDAITLGTAAGFTLWSGNKAVNRSVNADGDGATAAQWQEYLQKNLSVTLTGTGTKGLRMIASFEKVDRTLDYNSLNGHYYEVGPTRGLSWDKALKEAEKHTYLGMQGYLVTITSAEEQALVFSLVGTDTWIGGTCDDTYTRATNDWAKNYRMSAADHPKRWSTVQTFNTGAFSHYYWVSGPEAGLKMGECKDSGNRRNATNPETGETMFMFWSAVQPDGYRTGEKWMQMFGVAHDAAGAGAWNDLPIDYPAYNLSYVIEYGGMPDDADAAGAGGANADVDVDVDVDVYVKVDINIDPKGQTLSTEASNTTVGTKPTIYESVNGNTDIVTLVDGKEQPAEIKRVFSEKQPDGTWSEVPASELKDGYPAHAGTYKVVSSATYSVEGGKATPYTEGTAQFTIKPKVLDPAKDFVDSESGKTLEELGGTGSVPGSTDDEGDGTETPWLIDDKTPVPVDPAGEPMGKDAIAGDVEKRYGESEGFPTGGTPTIKITYIGDEGTPKTVEAIDPTTPGTYVVEATYPQPDGTEKKVRTIYTVAGPDGEIPGGGVAPEPAAKKPTLGTFNKVYDGTDGFDVTRLSFPGLDGAKVRLVAESAKYDSDAAGNRKLILTGVHLEGEDAGDYTIPGLVDGVLTLDAYIAPRELVITARSTVTFGAAHSALVDGAGKLAELRCDEDVHADAASPWLENMLAPEDAEWIDDVIESILGNATYTALREGDSLSLDISAPEAGLYKVAVHFDNVNPVAGATPAPAPEGEGGEASSETGEPETTPAAFAASAAKGLGLISTAYAAEYTAPAQVKPLGDNRFDLGNYILTLREGKVLVTDNAAGDTRLPEVGEVVVDEVIKTTVDPAATPIDPAGVKGIIDEKWGDKVPEGADPVITITKGGEKVDAIDPTTPGTYTVVAVYPDPEGGPEKIVRFTYIVEEPNTPDSGTQWPGDDGWTIDDKDKPIDFDPSKGPMDKPAIADDLEDRYGDHPEFPTGTEPSAIRITHVANDGTQRTVDVIDPDVPGTYIVEAEYTMPDGSKKYVRTSYVVPEKNNGGQAAAPTGNGSGSGDGYYGDAGNGTSTVVGPGSGMKDNPVASALKLAQTGDALALGAIAGVVLVAGVVLAVAASRLRKRRSSDAE